MKELNKAINKRLFWSITIIFMFPVGILLTVFGVVNSWWIMLAVGVVFIVVGFYGMHTIRISYGSLKSLRVI